MTDALAERLTKVETALDGHLRECNETNRRTEKSMDRMQTEFSEFTREFKASNARLHQRLDEQSTRVEQGFGQAEGARKDLRIAALTGAIGFLTWLAIKLMDGGLPGLLA